MKKSFNRKSLLLPLLLVTTGSAWAGWEEVYTTAEVTVYVDRATIRNDGNLRMMWSLINNKQRNKDGGMSLRMRNEYDCKGERRRYLALSGHAEPMAGGKVLFSHGENGTWRSIPPGTADEAVLKIVCDQ